MGYHQVGTQVTIGTICRRRERRIEATVLVGDIVPLGLPSLLWLEIDWTGSESDEVVARLSGPEGGGEVRFDAADGPTEKTLGSGDLLLLLDLVGVRATPGNEADLRLTLHVGDQEVLRVPLRVGAPTQRLRLRTGDRADLPLPLALAAQCTVSAVPAPQAQGEVRWRGRGVGVAAGDVPARVRVSPRAEAGEQAIAALFQPPEAPAVLAVHAFSVAGTTRAAGMWSKGLHGVGERTVKSGEQVAILVGIAAATYYIDERSIVSFDIWDQDSWFRGADDFMVSLLGEGAEAPNHRTPTRQRRVVRVDVPAGTSFADAVAEHRRFHPATWPEQILVLRMGGDRPDWRILVWWEAEAARADNSNAADVYFRLRIGDRVTLPCSVNETMQLSVERVTTPERIAKQAVRIQGRFVDRHPLDAGRAEPLPGVRLRGAGATAASGAGQADYGTFTLDGWIADGDQVLRIERGGVDARGLELRLRRSGGRSSVFLLDENDEVLARAEGAESDREPVTIDVGDIQLLVHKLRGVLYWPDSRTIRDANYRGTPLAGKRVHLVPLEEGRPITDQRPADSRVLDEWRPRSLASHRPGRAVENELTDRNGSFEVRFVEWRAGRRYFLWVEGLEPDSRAETPEYLVRTRYRELRRLTAPDAGTAPRLTHTDDIGHLVVDHQYNLTRDRVRFGVECLATVALPAADDAPPTLEVRRPRPRAKRAFDDGQAGEVLTYRADRSLVEDLNLHVLPLVPLGEAPERRADGMADVVERFHAAWVLRHPRGYAWRRDDLVLDARKIDNAVDLSAGAWDAAWGNDEPSRHLRRCELLEKTLLVRPSLPDVDALALHHALWQADVISLSEYAPIDIPAPPDNRIAHRTLASRFIAVLHPVTPLYAGLAGHRILLSPGHGFWSAPQASNNLANWRSNRGGFSDNAGEDENDGYMAHLCSLIMRANAVLTHGVREIDDLSARGVEHTGADAFAVSANRGWPRLWQQNPMYYLGALNDPIVMAGANIGDTLGSANDEGIVCRRLLAAHLFAQDPPLELMLNIHTNAPGNPWQAHVAARGTSAHYYGASVGGVIQNTRGQSYAQHLLDRITDQCHTNPGNVLHNSNASNASDTRRVWLDVSHDIASVIAEVAFHTNPDDLALLARNWFRRRAAEAMSLASEDQLRGEAGAVTRRQLKDTLEAMFGPTTAIVGLAGGNANATPADVRAALHAVTGDNAAVADARLNTLVIRAERARDGSTRQGAFTAVTNALAGVAGYDPATQAAETAVYVGRTLRAGKDPAVLPQGARPVLRDDLGTWTARGLGWTPQTLAKVTDTPVGGTRLIERLRGALLGAKPLPASEVEAIAGRIAALRPEDIWRGGELQIVDEADAVIEPVDNGLRYALRPGDNVRFRQLTRGIAWRMQPGDISFSLEFADGRAANLAGTERTRERLTSEPWEVDLPGVTLHRLTVSVTVPHPGGDRFRFHRSSMQVGALL